VYFLEIYIFLFTKPLYLCYVSGMNFFMSENSTRKNIILLLKKNRGMSIDELSKVIDITPMGIRQHLLTLEKKGFVSYKTKKCGIGRPGFVYTLTDTANELFPKTYDNLALGILRDIRKHEGHEKIEQIFSWRRERLFKMKKDALSGKENLDETLHGLKKILETEGHFVELSKNSGHYHLIQFHCPIGKVAHEFKDACSHELQLYRDLIGKDVRREHSVSEGAHSCIYIIPTSS
jgi:predicted ArsR family transcriptional regulator